MATRAHAWIRGVRGRSRFSVLCLLISQWGLFSPSPAPVAAAASVPWFAASIDTMKESMDTDAIPAQLSDTRIAATVNAIARLNPNYITVDTFWEYPSYTERWVNTIRATGRHVWFRMHPSQWEDDNGTTGIMTPSQYEQGLRAYILAHPSFFKPGDIFDPCPEASNAPYWNATYGGGWGHGAPDPGTREFNAFLRDTTNIADTTLHSLGIYGVITTVHSLNPFWYLSPHALEPATMARLQLITIDDYVDSGITNPAAAADVRLKQLTSIERRWHLPILIGEMGYPTPSQGSDATQAAVLQAEFRAMATVPYLAGVNYWAAVLASSSILAGSSGDWIQRPAAGVLAAFFTKQAQKAYLDGARYTWEEGTTQGWSGSGIVTSLATTRSLTYRGHSSLAVTMSGPGTGGIVTGKTLAALAGGSTLTTHILVPSGMGATTVQLFVVDANGKTFSSAGSNPAPAAWTGLTFTLPGLVQAPLQRLGFSFIVRGSGGVVFVDSIGDGPASG